MERVIAGFDGSPGSVRALGWALGQARLHRAELQPWTILPDRTSATGEKTEEDLRRAAGDITRGYAEPRFGHGGAAAGLIAACSPGDLLVVGSRGHNRLAGLLLGSVSKACLYQAPCPVTVVPDLPRLSDSHSHVIAAVDGSEHARHALRVAAEEAALRGVDLHAVHAVHWDSVGVELVKPDTDRLMEWGERTLDRELAETGVKARPLVVQGHPTDVLTRLGAEADLLVLGSHGRSRLEGVLLGSTSEYCAQHAPCPVMITRDVT
ncbi:universal stress protein [Nonomuraea ferruginea]|uniref:Universal stress protein n=1 Tax=Nonomuraea ferruginea TaxID=46174 RepID=A0ABT4T9W4_9ACTN|nr:universal stress protein [Nonomuraea ferruginea]MDA0645918.1 universal stress protein [Nonomuraea ferruginea]